MLDGARPRQYTLTLSLTRHTAQATALGTPSPNAAGTYGFMVIRLLVLHALRTLRVG